ncbi:MAG TPA: hypothetical protein VK674_01720 [Candidatus Limnocylindria bacterium]|nr:hypothetical protein [Candidatus Limnocylindria bacterium]
MTTPSEVPPLLQCARGFVADQPGLEKITLENEGEGYLVTAEGGPNRFTFRFLGTTGLFDESLPRGVEAAYKEDRFFAGAPRTVTIEDEGLEPFVALHQQLQEGVQRSVGRVLEYVWPDASAENLHVTDTLRLGEITTHSTTLKFTAGDDAITVDTAYQIPVSHPDGTFVYPSAFVSVNGVDEQYNQGAAPAVSELHREVVSLYSDYFRA